MLQMVTQTGPPTVMYLKHLRAAVAPEMTRGEQPASEVARVVSRPNDFVITGDCRRHPSGTFYQSEWTEPGRQAG